MASARYIAQKRNNQPMKRSGTLFKRNGIYNLRYIIEGVAFQVSLKTKNKAEAETMQELFMRDRQSGLDQYRRFLVSEVARIDKVTAEAPVEKILIGEAWTVFMKSPRRPRASSATLEHYLSAWTQFAAGLYSVVCVSEITEDHATARMALLESTGVSQGTAEKHLIYLKAILSCVLPAGSANPFDGAVARGDAVSHSYRPFSMDQLRSVIRAADDHKDREVYGLALVLAYTGLRLVDAATLRIEEIDFERNVIERIPEKTKRYGYEATIGIHPALRFELGQFIVGRSTGFVFEKMAARSRESRSGVIKSLLKVSGVQILKERGSGRSQCVYGSSSFRHTIEDRLRRAGVHQVVINRILCHQDKAMAGVYSTVGDDELVEAIVKAYPDVRPCAAKKKKKKKAG